MVICCVLRTGTCQRPFRARRGIDERTRAGLRRLEGDVVEACGDAMPVLGGRRYEECRRTQVTISATTAGSTCWAGSYSAGLDGPLPAKKRWLSASYTCTVASGRPARQPGRSSSTVAW